MEEQGIVIEKVEPEKRKKVNLKRLKRRRIVRIKKLIKFYIHRNDLKKQKIFRFLRLKLVQHSRYYKSMIKHIKNLKLNYKTVIGSKIKKIKKFYKYKRKNYYNYKLKRLYNLSKYSWLKIYNKSSKKKSTRLSLRTYLEIQEKKNLYLKLNKLKIFKFNKVAKFKFNWNKIRQGFRTKSPKYTKFTKLNIRETLFKNIYYKKKRIFIEYLIKNYKKLLPSKIYKKRKKFYKVLLNIKLKFRKIKKHWFEYSTYNYLINHKNFDYIFHKNTKDFNINNFLWLNSKGYEHYLLNFFFHKKKFLIKKNISSKTFFFNFRNKKLKTYRTARFTHWKYFTTKTIKKRRYQKFLNFFLKKQNSLFQNIFTFFTFKFRLSYHFWLNFNFLYHKHYFIQNTKKPILQLPIHEDFWSIMTQYDAAKQFVDSKILLWQSRRIQIKKTFWMQQKKNIPKFIKKKIFNVVGIKNSIQYDFITNYFVILKNLNYKTHNNIFIFKNKYLKLHGFKYNS